MKRPMTLTAGILGIVSQAVILIFSIINLIGAIAIMGGGSSAGVDASVLASAGIIMFIIIAVALVIGILGLIFNIISTTTWNKTAEVYNAKKGKTITAIVFNFLGIVAVFLTLSTIIAVLIMFVLIAAGVLAIVDLCLENRRIAKLAGKDVSVATAVGKFVGNVQTAIAEAKPNNDLEAKIEKLNEMKEQGLISDEEYEELKKSYIKEKVNG